MVDVFISYGRADQAEAERLANRLSRLGLGVWFDRGLTPGLDYAEEILTRLHGAKVVIVCWSERSVQSKWVFSESLVGLAKNNLIPISLEPSTAPDPFGTVQSINMARWAGRGRHPGWLQLLQRLGVILDQPDLVQRDADQQALRADAKRIVLSFDAPFITETTHPLTLREIIVRKDAAGTQQVVRYVSGITMALLRERKAGAAPINSALSHGAVSDRVMESYTFLVDNFEPGDEIYLFGAATGGAAARSLAALVGRCGILRRDKLTKLRDALQLGARKMLSEGESRSFRLANSVPTDSASDPEGAAPPQIAYLGLWESTVPMSTMRTLLRIYGLTRPAKIAVEDFSHVRAVRQAIALDETFPVLECASVLGSRAQDLQEMWFPGMLYELIQQEAQGKPLSNSAAPLLWILDGAEEAGLALDHLHPRYLSATQAKPEPPARAKIPFIGRSRNGPNGVAHVSDAALRLRNLCANYRPMSLRGIESDLKAIDAATLLEVE